MKSVFLGLLCLSALVLIHAQDTCDSCKFLIGGFELSLVNPDGSTNVDSENYKQIEGYLHQGCMTLFSENEEYKKFCTSGVTTFFACHYLRPHQGLPAGETLST